MPKKLYNKVEEYIPNEIGVYLYNEETKSLTCVIKAKKQNISIEETNNLLLSMVRSMARDVNKLTQIEDDSEYKKLKDKYRELDKKETKTSKQLSQLENTLFMLLGSFHWREELETAKYLCEKSNATLKYTLQPINDKKEIEIAKDVNTYKVFEQAVLEYLKNKNIKDEIPDWLGILYANATRDTIRHSLSMLSLSRDKDFKYVLSNTTKEMLHNEFKKLDERNAIPHTPYLREKEREFALSNMEITLKDKLINEYNISKGKILSLLHNVPYMYENETTKEKYYFVYQKGIDYSKYCCRILMICIEKNKNNENVFSYYTSMTNKNGEFINNNPFLDILNKEETFPITKDELDYIFALTTKSKCIPMMNLKGCFHLDKEIPITFFE
jgi:hypothetical protein